VNKRTGIQDKKTELPNVAIFVKRTAIEFLQILFSQRATGSFHFDSDDTKTEIFIADQHTTNLNAIEVHPAIIAVRGPVSWLPTGLGGSGVESRTVQTGKTTFNDLLIGSVAFSCFSREGLECEQIAHLVFNSFKFFSPELRKLGFFQIRSLNIGAEALVEQEGSDDKVYMVPVYVTVAVQDRWSLSDVAARKLREVITETLICP